MIDTYKKREIVDGVLSTQENICFFSSFSKESMVHEYIYYLLNELKKGTKSDIVFVTTSNEININDIERLKALCFKIIIRGNIYYDFGSYFCGLDACSMLINNYQKIFFCNDSVYGPIYSFESIVEEMSASCADVWGITESYEISYHLQSYFLCFEKRAYAHLIDFISGYEYPNIYEEIVRKGEIALSQYMLANKLNLLAYVSQEKLLSEEFSKYGKEGKSKCKHYYERLYRKYLRRNLLFTHWKESIEFLGNPFIKVKLLYDSSFIKFHYGEWINIIGDKNPELLKFIRMHLIRRNWENEFNKDRMLSWRIKCYFSYVFFKIRKFIKIYL